MMLLNLIEEHSIYFAGIVEHSFLILILNNHVPGPDKVFQVYLGRLGVRGRTLRECDDCLFIYLFIYSSIYSFIHELILLFVYLFIYLFIHSFIHLFIYSFICSFFH